MWNSFDFEFRMFDPIAIGFGFAYNYYSFRNLIVLQRHYSCFWENNLAAFSLYDDRTRNDEFPLTVIEKQGQKS
jgi:hypothetical protein